jgi:hypothetical protein
MVSAAAHGRTNGAQAGLHRRGHHAAGSLLGRAASPEGWFLAGSDPGSYKIERDTTVTHEGKEQR